MINNATTFNSHGVTIPTPNGGYGLIAGQNITIRPTGDSAVISAVVPFNRFNDGITPWQPPSLADTDAPKNSVYFSTTATKLVYKGSDGTVHALY